MIVGRVEIIMTKSTTLNEPMDIDQNRKRKAAENATTTVIQPSIQSTSNNSDATSTQEFEGEKNQ